MNSPPARMNEYGQWTIRTEKSRGVDRKSHALGSTARAKQRRGTKRRQRRPAARYAATKIHAPTKRSRCVQFAMPRPPFQSKETALSQKAVSLCKPGWPAGRSERPHCRASPAKLQVFYPRQFQAQRTPLSSATGFSLAFDRADLNTVHLNQSAHT